MYSIFVLLMFITAAKGVKMRGLKRCYYVLKKTGTLKVFFSFIVFLCFSAVLLRFIEPQIETFGDGFWYCFVAATTIGFGDIYVVTTIGRLLTILVSVYGILMVAMVPGVIVSYYIEYIKMQERETISEFLEKLERLPELSKPELEDLSDRIKKFNKRIK